VVYITAWCVHPQHREPKIGPIFDPDPSTRLLLDVELQKWVTEISKCGGKNMLFVVGNIAPETTEEEFKTFLEQFGEITKVTLATSGSSDHYSAEVDIPVDSQVGAEAIADKLNGMMWKNRPLEVNNMLFFKEEKK
jgi:hypothetical protein